MPDASHLRWPALAELAPALLVVPVGATEQHGPHLPLTVDTDIAVALAGALGRERRDVVVAPPLAFGASGEHQGFPGTLSIGREATELVLVELARSATETFPRVLFVSTHGGNRDAVRAACALVAHEGRDVRAWTPRWEGDAHAGHVETSVMLALHPERVTMAAAAQGDVRPLAETLSEMRRGGVRAVSANGILGDATTATVEDGRTFLRRAVTDLVATVEGWVGERVVPGAGTAHSRALLVPSAGVPGRADPVLGGRTETNLPGPAVGVDPLAGDPAGA